MASEYDRDYDIHVIAGALKCYLRELPEPLLTHVLHDQWLEAARQPDHQSKLRSMWLVVNNLPAQNRNNLRYLLKFLTMLCSYSSINKMTMNNIAIVIAPNLIWSQRELDEDPVDITSIGRNMTLGSDYRIIVEHLLEYCDYFFKEDVDFGVSPKTPLSKVAPNGIPGQSTTLPRSNHKRNVSTDSNVPNASHDKIVPGSCESPKQPQRRKKQAPKPPQAYGNISANTSAEDELSIYGSERMSNSSSPEQSRSHTKDSSAGDMNSSSEQLSSAPGTPAPAPRLHHSSSIKRPTIEPPKPPGSNIIKPPRPSPPLVQNEKPQNPDAKLDNKHDRPPIGFDLIASDKEPSKPLQEDPEPVMLRPKHSEGAKKDGAGPIGFAVDDDDPNKDKISVSNVASFRKSLENVLQQQAAGQPVILPRHQQSHNSTSSDGMPANPDEGETNRPSSNISTDSSVFGDSNIMTRSFQKPSGEPTTMSRNMTAGVPVLPVPATRTMKEPGDKPEPAVSRYEINKIL